MALCGGSVTCPCAFQSSSLIIDGTGNSGNPLTIETYEGIVADQSDIVTPFIGQRIYETSTDRLLVYNGSNWIIYGGNMPGFQIERQTPQTIISDDPTSIIFPGANEIYDTDGFHAGSDAFITIPSGLGGDWLFVGHASWASSGVGYRSVRFLVSGNTGPPTQNNQSRSGGYSVEATANNGYSTTEMFRIEPGATVALSVIHNVGADTTVTSAALKGIMLRHDPTLT